MAMSITTQEQLAGVPPQIWDALNVDPQQRFAEVWAEWPVDTRQRLLTLCRSESEPTTPWRTLPQNDREKILQVLERCRALYIACDLTTNWRHCFNAMNTVEEV